MKVIKIHSQYIELQQLLKMTSTIHSGGEAKYYLAENPVLVNNLKESRRGRKLYPGDKVDIQHEIYLIEADEN